MDFKHCQVLPEPKGDLLGLFTDLDETYWSDHHPAFTLEERRKFEMTLAEEAQKRPILFAWVTGARLPLVLERARKHQIELLPHCIASGLGVEIHYIDLKSRKLIIDAQWEDCIVTGRSEERRVGKEC